MKNKKIALNGGEAISYALKQIELDVFAMYPITPQTPIIESYAKFAADGEVDCEIVRVESEHSALSVVVGAASAGARAVTATASQGLLYMFEMLALTSGLRLPIVMPVVNRATSAPINIHCDHSDSMSAIDQGWMQVYCEDAQEAYAMTLFSTKLAEKVYLPIMICSDGFVTSHNLETIEVFDDKVVKKFVGEYKGPYNLLNTEKPISIGPLALPDYFFEIKVQMFDAFKSVEKEYKEISKDFEKFFGEKINICEDYFASKSEIVIVVLSSTAQSTKDVIDKLRLEKKSVGLLRPILFRPFIYKEYAKYLKKAKTVIVLDRSEGPGSHAPLFKDISLSVINEKNKPNVYSYVFGLGGRDLYQKDIEKLLNDFLNGKINKNKYLGLRK
ncbi:MAG: pyruvate ferredoxin oxidoreductase [archaeon]|jgi:pyruvate ferredoxin oxidoreductase alpha subunit|nr:pyruvate ferredoxin oxidoreductase [archaeon]MDD2477743.1 pyruvate ferredoxin oxidoreductase [Candidatus ainarchaeum sp.]MDD3084634.1 pyruvate ferredoxin oxidoreductase [Candidatus ainarchaeum sp.]MDD4221320.1 pyruvate ferredoxin oxidoreductase [Candidatus ainarchaeum sp.]MDD4662829.1 pyruvate ferredoxin oxidoreductase [Candidatus ainarchaeum sp.]